MSMTMQYQPAMTPSITKVATNLYTPSKPVAKASNGEVGAEFQKTLKHLEAKITSSKRESAAIKGQITREKARLNDETLSQTARDVASIPSNSTNLSIFNKLKGHRDKILSIDWNRDSQHLLSVSQDGFMIVWDAITGLKKNALVLDSEWVLTSAYSPSGRLAASGGLKNTCVIYNVGEGTTGAQPPPQRAANYVKGNMASQPHQQSWNLQQTKAFLKGHRCYISDCDFLDDNTIITASGDLSCALWDINKSVRVQEYNQHLGDVLCMTVQHSAQQFLSGSADGFVRLWDIRSPVPVQQFQVSNSDTTAVKYFPDAGSFAVGSDDGIVRLFDLRADCKLEEYALPQQLQKKSRAQHQQMQQHQQQAHFMGNASISLSSINDVASMNSDIDCLGISSLDFSRSGRVLYVCYSDFGCYNWDLLKNEVVGQLKGHSSRINQVSVSPDGFGVATSSWDSTINIFSN